MNLWSHNLKITAHRNLLFANLLVMDGNNVLKRCRACLITGVQMHHLKEKYTSIDESIGSLLELLKVSAAIQISLNDAYPQYICKVCVKRASDSHLFRLQCESAASQLDAELKPKIISSVKAEYKEESPLLEHDNRNSLSSPISNLSIKSKDETNSSKQWPCDQCDKEFKYRTSMIKHKRKHGITNRSCMFCNEAFETAAALARHMEQMHAHLKTIKCSLCSKAFFKQANLRLHMNVHSGVKRHMCEVCGMSFALAGNLTAHRRLHTGQKPYKCKECGRGFTQQAALRSHEAGHSNKKEHVCSECGAAFSRAGALRNHCKRHLSIRPFVCTLCSKAFTFSSERKRHMTIHTGEKKHECNICGSRFNRSTNLAVHRRIHTGETPHVCSICGKRFSQAHCLRSHMTTIHSCVT